MRTPVGANDHRTLHIGPWARRRFLMFDLGPFRYHLFNRIDRNGSLFLTPLPGGANPRIVGTHRRWRGRSIELEGKGLNEVAAHLKRSTLNVAAQVAFQHSIHS